MRLTKIATLLLAAFVAFTPLQNVEAKPKTTITKSVKKTSKKEGRKVAKKSAKKAKKSTASQKATKPSNQTKKLYGVKGATIQHVKVSTSTRTYKEKGKHHKIIGKEASRRYSQTGIASYYGNGFHGKKTATGEVFNKHAFTAAHKTLALGSYALVTNLRNGKKVIVRINDRGPFSKTRILDLSEGAARELGMIHSGTARVRVEAMQVDKQGYIVGKGAKSLHEEAKKKKLPHEVKGKGDNFAIKAIPASELKNAKSTSNSTASVKLSKPKYALKVVQLANAKAAKKVANAVKAKTHTQANGKKFDVIIDVASSQESAKVKRQLTRLGYSVFSYSEK